MRATEIGLHTSDREMLIEITRQLEAHVAEQGWHEGMLVVHAPHTTAGLFMTENADPDVPRDIMAAFSRMVPVGGPWIREGRNSDAHAKAVLTGQRVTIPVLGGKMQLGRWQGVFFAEFDGPRDRTIRLYFTQG